MRERSRSATEAEWLKDRWAAGRVEDAVAQRRGWMMCAHHSDAMSWARAYQKPVGVLGSTLVMRCQSCSTDVDFGLGFFGEALCVDCRRLCDALRPNDASLLHVCEDCVMHVCGDIIRKAPS